MESDELDIVDARLRTRFSALKTARGGAPVYALEHGLTVTELGRLRRAAGPMLRLHGVSDWWTDRPLGLIVLATETGYRYRGTGTDFWPVLGARLGASFTGSDRERLTGLFESAHRSVGLRRPADTLWNLAFRHIAWPITNAVAPTEIHRPLARALHRMFQRPPAVFEGADLAAALRRAAVSDGAAPRLMQWLKDDQLAAVMAGRLLALPDDGFLDPGVVSRIWSDMASDASTRRALGDAIAEHRQLLTGSRGFARYGRAHLALRVNADGPVLELVPPTLSAADQDRLSRLCESRAARLWNAATQVNIRRLSEGRAIALDLERLPEARDAFLADADTEDLDGAAVTALRGFAPDLSGSLLFPAGDGASPQAAAVRPYAAGRWWWIARGRVHEEDGVTIIGRLGDADVVEIEVDRPGARAWLESQGVAVERGPVLEPVMASALDSRPQGYDLPLGLPALFRVAGEAHGLTAVLAADEAALCADSPFVAVDDDPAGEHRLILRSEFPDTVCGWRRLPASSSPAPVGLVADAPEFTLEALLDGEFSLRILCAPGIATSDLTLRVTTGGAEIARAVTATDGAALYGGGSPLFRDLAAQLKQAGIFDRGELSAELAGLVRESWPLGRRLRNVRWERRDEAWAAVLEGEIISKAMVSASTPHMSPGDNPSDSDVPMLLLPISGEGSPLETDGLIVGPRSLTLGTGRDEDSLDGVGRAWDAPGDQGLRAACGAWIRWSCASTSHLILDLVRIRAIRTLERRIVRQLCGRGWLSLEDAQVRTAGGFWQAMADIAISRGMAAGDGFPALAETNRHVLQECLAGRLAEAVPDLRSMSADAIETASADLDEAVNTAWEDHFQALERAGAAFHLEDECDAGNDGSAWAAAAREADDRCRLGPLSRRLVPAARARALTDFDYEAAGISDISALLDAEHVDLRARQPHWLGEVDLRRALMFWISPRIFSHEAEGPETLQKLLADRQTARAVRYTALRYISSRGGSGVAR